MNKVGLWFHQLFNPHCSHCALLLEEERERKAESKVCDTCEVLKSELAQAHNQIRELQSVLIHPTKTEEPRINTSELKPILPSRIPWKVRQQMLEKEDRHAAELIRNRATQNPNPKSVSIEELEAELGVMEEKDAVSGSNEEVQERPAS